MWSRYKARSLSDPSLDLLQLSPEAARLYFARRARSKFGHISTRGYPRILATRRFLIVHDWRDVLLCLPDRDPLSIGTHYDEPRAIALAPNGLWCASGGCGVIIYHLCNPYHPFIDGVESDQWWEIGRDEDEPWLVDRLRVVGDERLRVDVDPESSHGGVYDVNVARRTIRRRHLTVVPSGEV